MPKKLRFSIRESPATQKGEIKASVDDGFSGEEIGPEKSIVVETVILWALHFPDGNFDQPGLEIDMPIKLTQAQLKFELARLSQRTLPGAIKCRNLNICEEASVETESWDMRVRSLESVYG